MVTKTVKVYVSEDIHVVLSQIQADLKEKLQKKVALAEILLEFAKTGMENFSKINFNVEKDDDLEKIAIKIPVSGKINAILLQIQADLKEKLQKKVALAEILLEFVKIGMQKDRKVGFTQNEITKSDVKEHFTQNETANNDVKDNFTQNEIANNDVKDSYTQNKIANTQNYNNFTQNLITKQLQNTQNEQYFEDKHNNFEQKEKKLKVWEQELKELDKELKEEREYLFEQRWELVRLQEEVTSKLLDSRDKSITIRQLEKEMLRLSNDFVEKHKKQTNEIYNLEKKYRSDTERYINKISELETEKRELLNRLDRFENTLNNLKFSSDSLNASLKHFISTSNEKSIIDYIEPLLPAILTFGVLNKDKITEKFNELKKEVLKPKSENELK